MEELNLESQVWYEGGTGTVQWMGWTTEEQTEPIILLKNQDINGQYAFDQDLQAVYLSDIQVSRRIPVYPLQLNQHLHHPLTQKDIKGRVRKDGRVGLSYNNNSCYLDVTLMSMFAFSDAFDDLIPQVPVLFPEWQDPAPYIKLRVQAALKEIVHQIRCKLLVGPEPVQALRKLLSTHQQQEQVYLGERWETSENDPITLISVLVSKILETSLIRVWEPMKRGRRPKRPILSSRDVIFTFFQGQGVPLVTYQQLFEEGMRYYHCSLDTFPKRLVIQLPGDQGPGVPSLWPSFVLDITDSIHQGPHQCQLCGLLAQVQCQACYNLFTENEASTYYCRRCSDRVHKMMTPALKANHSVQMLSADQLGDWPAGSVPPRTIMRLRSVLCISHHHYTGFLRVDDSGNPSRPHHWVFYNDMGPQMSEFEMERLATSRVKSHLVENGLTSLPGQQKQLFRNAYVLFYDSPQKTYF